jgi:hypothetical protein
LVETIKSEVAQKDWARREWTDLRRIKLEALLDKMHECDTYLKTHRFGEEFLLHDPVSELDTIGTLYFPELRSEVYAFTKAARDDVTASFNLREALLGASDPEIRRKTIDEFLAKYDTGPLSRASNTLRDAARKLLVEIMGVDKEP